MTFENTNLPKLPNIIGTESNITSSNDNIKLKPKNSALDVGLNELLASNTNNSNSKKQQSKVQFGENSQFLINPNNDNLHKSHCFFPDLVNKASGEEKRKIRQERRERWMNKFGNSKNNEVYRDKINLNEKDKRIFSGNSKDTNFDLNIDKKTNKHLTYLLCNTINKHNSRHKANGSKKARVSLGWDIRSVAQNGTLKKGMEAGKGHHLHHSAVISENRLNDETPTQRFKRNVRKLIVLNRVCMTIRLLVMDTHGHMVFHQMGTGNPSENYTDLSKKNKKFITNKKNNRKNTDKSNSNLPTTANFNLSDFKSHAEFKFPKRGRTLCDRQPALRTDSNVAEIRRLMLTLEAFRTYSPDVQTLMCKRIRYARYERRRLIIRKGHVATNLYFIFSGKVGVATDVEGTSVFTDAEPILLGKGSVFGETGLIKGIKRNCSIVCMESTEFLVIDKDDFLTLNLFDIYKQIETREINERFNYFRENPLFKSCDDEKLNFLAQTCKSQWFIHNQVIVKDSTKTETINFVKSGRVGIVRLLHLDSCLSFKQSLVESGCFPKIHKLNDTIRSDPTATQLKVDTVINKLKVPDLNFSTYLEVNQLQAGQVFGLDNLAYPDDRVFSLISEGCELLRVPLSAIVELVGRNVLKDTISQICSPCPTDEELCKLFLAKNHWMFYRNQQVKSVVNQSILNRVHAPINSMKYQRGSNVHDICKKEKVGYLSLEDQINNLNKNGTDDWLSGCVQMPWNIDKSIKHLNKYMAYIDINDARGEFKKLKSHLLKKNEWWLENSNSNNSNPELNVEQNNASTRRRGQLDPKNKSYKDRKNSIDRRLDNKTNNNLIDNSLLCFVNDKSVEDYDPRARAIFLKKEVERIERNFIHTEDDHANKRRGLGAKARNKVKNSTTDGRVTRLIQGIALPTFKLSSFN